MILKCVAIDDEPLALDLLKEYIARIPSLKLCETFENAVAAIEYLKKNQTDILLVDINMPDINGIELVKFLKTDTAVIFTTAYKQFAYEGFELSATDYLVKPIDFNRFEKGVQKAIAQYRYKHGISEGAIYVYSEYAMVKINFSDIEYIEGMEDYIRIHCNNRKPVMTLMSLKKILSKLPADQFKRVHKSYIIAIQKVKSIKNKKISILDMELPIGNSYLDEVKSWIRQ
ncbi:LytR/AlgR family response regulator transcription factor [Pseudopedobacter beijingensis]|uniref:LytR/AlgR family response regulator transcription factor n=1 Tax=Pseudopedobacter beijingensis TaxID=1207056 RepID=A0ABW4IHN3_9SPHI